MDSALIGSLSALGGVVIGDVLAAIRNRTAFRREKAWELNDEKRRRLEELYEALEEVNEAYGLLFGDAVYITRTLQRPPPGRPKTPVPWAKLRMLVNLYVPALQEPLDRVSATGAQVASTVAKVISDLSMDHPSNEARLDAVSVALAPFNEAVEEMRNAIVNLSQELSRTAAANADRAIQGELAND